MYPEERIHLIIDLTRASSCNWSFYFNSGCISRSDGLIILPFLHLSCPRLKLILFSQIGPQIYNIKCGTNPKSCRQLKLVCIIINLFQHFKRTSSSRHLDLLNSGKRSFLKCNQTRSPGSKVTCFRPLLPASLYFSFIASMFALVVSCNFNISSARCVASRFNFSESGIGNKSMGARGTKPYTISKGHDFVVECSERLYANSI